MNIFLVEFDLQKQNNQQFNLETTNKVMPRRSTRSRRYVSDSQSESSYDDSGPKKTEDLYAQLKDALVHNDRYIQRTIRSISDDYKETVGVVRVTIPESFTFNQNDIEDFFRRFGRIQNIILKQNTNRLYEETNKNKEVDSIAYIIFSEYFSAVLAVKVINSAPEKERVVSAKICSTDQTIKQTKLGSQPSLNSYSTDNMVIEIQHDYEFGDIVKSFKYVGTIGMDITDKTFPIKSRIIGVKGANFVRIHFLCEKSFRFENQGEQSHLNDLDMRLILNKSQQIPRDVLVLSNCLQKYNKAMHYLHQLMEQIVEQYKNSKEKSIQIIPKDIHIRRWEKFNSEPQLKFLT